MGIFLGGEGGDGLKELSILRLLRLTRLSRLGRIGRLLRFFPKAQVMLKGLGSSMTAVFWAFPILVMMLYIFAIIFKTQSEDTELVSLFPTIPDSMWVLLLHGTFMDNITDFA